MQSPQLEWIDVESSNVHSVAYHHPTETLVVRFNNGGLYSYSGTDSEVFVSLVHSDSVGGYFARAVRHFPYLKWEDETALLNYLLQR